MKRLISGVTLGLLLAGDLMGKEFHFKSDQDAVLKGIVSLRSIGQLKPCTEKEQNRQVARYFKADGVRRVAFSGDSNDAGQSHAFTYKGKTTNYHGIVVFAVRSEKGGAVVNITIDQYRVETGKVFNIHNFNFQSTDLTGVQSTGAEENHLALRLAERLKVKVDAPVVPLVDLRR